jgi:hypothetical protein
VLAIISYAFIFVCTDRSKQMKFQNKILMRLNFDLRRPFDFPTHIRMRLHRLPKMIRSGSTLPYRDTDFRFYVRFKVLTVASIKYRVVWDVAPCSYVEVDQRFRGASCLHNRPDDGGSMHFSITSLFLLPALVARSVITA